MCVPHSVQMVQCIKSKIDARSVYAIAERGVCATAECRWYGDMRERMDGGGNMAMRMEVAAMRPLEVAGEELPFLRARL